MERPDVDSLVCTTDAGREGELIFRLVYHQCRCKKPFERLWISSMEDAAIREGFQNLRPGSAYDNLYEAALCRERADWIVGMNATRFFSCLYGTTLAAVGKPHRYAEMKITLSCGGRTFTAKDREEIFDGWRQVEKHFRQTPKKTADEKEAQILPAVSEGQEFPIENAQIKEGRTSPPKRFTEDTMLSSMETAGTKEMPDDAERKGARYAVDPCGNHREAGAERIH